MIVLVGASASGKSTLEKELCKEYGMNKIVSYTTRPMRNGEIDGVDYHFVSEEKFNELENQGFFLEIGVYREWKYASAKKDFTEDSVAVLTPEGAKELLKYNETLENKFDVITIYIDVDQRSRLIKLLQRGDDIDEAIRRNQSDALMFMNTENEVDYVIKNYEYRFDVEYMVSIVHQILEDHYIGEYHKYYGGNN